MYLFIFGSERSQLGFLCQLSIVVGELVGEYAQLIWVGGGFGDLPMEEEAGVVRTLHCEWGSKEDDRPAWVAGSVFRSDRLACTHHLLHSHCDGLGCLHHRGLVVHKGPLWLAHRHLVQL